MNTSFDLITLQEGTWPSLCRGFAIMIKKYVLTILTLTVSQMVFAQDPQFTQFYAAPMYLNPAFAGSALAPRITANYRNQWPAITNYVTTMVALDHFIEKYNSGIGLMIQSDNQGQGRIQSTDIGLQYSYQFQVSEESFVRLGLQGSYVNRNINYFGLTTGDQFTDRGFITGSVTGDPTLLAGSPKNKYLDFSTGGLFYSDWFWIGASAHHINRPDQGFFCWWAGAATDENQYSGWFTDSSGRFYGSG